MSENHHLSKLVQNRLQVLDITRRELVSRLGYVNINKGMRRVDAILDGDLQMAEHLREKLATALEIDLTLVDQAIAETRAAIVAENERRYRDNFVPHAIILTERSIPSPIFVAAFLGVDRLRRIDFEACTSPATFADQVRRQLPEVVPAFGKTTGFVVNYSPDAAVEFDNDGQPKRRLDSAARIGKAILRL